MSLNEYCYLLNEAQHIINVEVKYKFEIGKITSPYEIFYEPTWLDVVQIFDYELDYWNNIAINQELRSLIHMIEAYNISKENAIAALKRIASYILYTETCHYWNYQSNGVILKRLLQKYFPANKPLNYDYLRFVLNTDYINQNEVEVTV